MALNICLGFDGSSSDDWSALRAETAGGFQFTPTYGPDNRPTIWDPKEFGGQIPRNEVHAAMEEVFAGGLYRVERAYFDPFGWETEIDNYALAYGEKVVMRWVTGRLQPMHSALVRFQTDLGTGALTHDGCPITKTHISNAVKMTRPGERYLIGKPPGKYHQKIDAAMSSVLAHEAASDARLEGWTSEDTDDDNSFFFLR